MPNGKNGLRRQMDEEMIRSIKVIPLMDQKLDLFLEAHKEWKENEFKPLKAKVESHEKKFWYFSGGASAFGGLIAWIFKH